MTDGLLRTMENTPESIARRMRMLRERAGLSLEQFAKLMGYKGASSIQRYENPDKLNAGYLKRDFVASVEKALLGKGNPPIQRPEIWELAGPEFNFAPPPPPNAVVGAKITTSGPMIPVYGSAVGGLDGEFEMNGSFLYEIMAPPSISPIKDAYGVQVVGESMEPRYFDGEVVYVDPTRRVKRGDFVIVQLKREEEGPLLGYVKRFVRHNVNELVLEQYNPAKQLQFDAKTVLSVHYIVLGGSVT